MAPGWPTGAVAGECSGLAGTCVEGVTALAAGRHAHDAAARLGWVAFSKSGVGFFGRSIPRAAAPNRDLAAAFFTAHSVVAWVLVARIALHVLAAFNHPIVDRDVVFQRLWFS